MTAQSQDLSARPARPKRLLLEVVSGLLVAAVTVVAFVGGAVLPESSQRIASIVCVPLLITAILAIRPLPEMQVATRLTRNVRRAGVIAYFLGWIVVFWVIGARSIDPSLGMSVGIVGVIGMALIMVGLLALDRRIGGVWLSRNARLDEREIRVRQAAFTLTCRFAVVCNAIALLLALWADRPGILAPGMMTLIVIDVFGCLTVLAMSLPSAIVAWKEETSNADD